MMSRWHCIQWEPDWQYGEIHWLALPTESRVVREPPIGEGWELNVDMGEGGYVVTTPAWSDGSIVRHHIYWRRRLSGMRPWQKSARVREDRRPWWKGITVPDGLHDQPDYRGLKPG